jgi:hypothetical protein
MRHSASPALSTNIPVPESKHTTGLQRMQLYTWPREGVQCACLCCGGIAALLPRNMHALWNAGCWKVRPSGVTGVKSWNLTAIWDQRTARVDVTLSLDTGANCRVAGVYYTLPAVIAAAEP